MIFDLSDKTNLLSTHTTCPVCNEKYARGVPYVKVPCKCGNTYNTDFNMGIYDKKARLLNSALSRNDEVEIVAEEKYENAIIHIKEHFIKFGCWDVSEITENKKEYKLCYSCGICYECITCEECGHTQKINPNRKKQVCVVCGCEKYKRTTFIDAKKNNKGKVECPHCKSKRIGLTNTTNKTKCHKCSGKNLSETKITKTLHLTISRKKGYRLKNIE